jgi:hypothetical protein
MILNILTEWLHKLIGLDLEVQGRPFSSIIIVFALWCLHRLILRIVLPRIIVPYRKEKINMAKTKFPRSVLVFCILVFGFAIANGERSKSFAQDTDAKTFKSLKEKMINSQTGLPRT